MKTAILAAATGVFLQVVTLLAATNDLPNTITVDGVTYEEVRWGAATSSSVTIFHKTGIARIPLERLPVDLQRHFSYDPEKAAVFKQADRAAQAQAQASQVKALQRESQHIEQQNLRTEWERQIRDGVVLDGKFVSTNKLKYATVQGTLRERKPEGVLLEVPVYVTAIQHDPLRSIGGGGGAALRAVPAGTDYAIVKDCCATNAIGSQISVQAVEVNPVDGIRCYDTGRKPTFDEWRKLTGH